MALEIVGVPEETITITIKIRYLAPVTNVPKLVNASKVYRNQLINPDLDTQMGWFPELIQ